jgi:hypothetical protein
VAFWEYVRTNGHPERSTVITDRSTVILIAAKYLVGVPGLAQGPPRFFAALRMTWLRSEKMVGPVARHGRSWSRTKWTRLHWAWIERQEYSTEASRRVLADYVRAVQEATTRVERLEKDIEELVETWALAPLVKALQALRGGVRLKGARVILVQVLAWRPVPTHERRARQPRRIHILLVTNPRISD